MSPRDATDRLSSREWLAGARLIAARELGAGFDSGIAPIAAIVFTLLASSIFMNEFFLAGVVDMGPYFELQPLLLAVFLPAVSMRLWAEERRQRTLELLLTLPLTPGQAALGKFVAALGLFGLFVAGSLPIPLLLAVLGAPDWGLVVGGYLGMLLLGGALLAIGGLLSALARDQLTAFVTSALAGLFLVLSGRPEVVAVIDGLTPFAAGTFMAESLSALPRYEELSRGVVSLATLLWFAGVGALGVWSTALVLTTHRD